MTDIHAAIAQLREAAKAVERSAKPIEFQENIVMYSIDAPIMDDMFTALTALEQAVEGDDLTARIEAAAEEIAEVVRDLFDDQREFWDENKPDITAIIRKHVEGKEA